MTDHTNTVTTYDHNKAGQLEKVSGNLIPQVSDYATDFRYRAWGGLKGVSYANSSSQSVQYNRRLLPTGASLNNVRTDNMQQTGNLSWSYSYYPDANDDRFDRLFQYDFAGRMKEAYSGREARALPASSPHPDSPVRQSFTYNAFNEPTGKTGRFWRTEQAGTEPCVPRTSTDGCDANGNVLTTNYGAQTYDAEDHQVQHKNHRYQVEVSQGWFEPAIEIAQTYDGVGQVAKREETRRREELVNGGPETEVDTTVTTTYYIYSTALGGAKVIELKGDGQKDTTYVYANGIRLGKLKNGLSFSWAHLNPGSNSWIESSDEGTAVRQEMDPDGAEVGTIDPALQVIAPGDVSYEKWHDEPLYIEGGDPFDFISGYTLNGLPMTRGELKRIEAGLGVLGLNALIIATGYRIPLHLRGEVHLYDDRQLSEFESWPIYFQDRTITLKDVKNAKRFRPNENVIDMVNKALADPDCFAFMQEVLSKASTKDNPVLHGGDIRQILKDFLAQTKAGFAYLPPGNEQWGTVSGTIGKDAIIFSRVTDDQDAYDATTIVNELMHLAGSKGGWPRREYGDMDLAIAINSTSYATKSTINGRWEDDAKVWAATLKKNPKAVGGFKNPFLNFPDNKSKKKNSGHPSWSNYTHDIAGQLCKVSTAK